MRDRTISLYTGSVKSSEKETTYLTWYWCVTKDPTSTPVPPELLYLDHWTPVWRWSLSNKESSLENFVRGKVDRSPCPNVFVVIVFCCESVATSIINWARFTLEQPRHENVPQPTARPTACLSWKSKPEVMQIKPAGILPKANPEIVDDKSVEIWWTAFRQIVASPMLRCCAAMKRD